MIMGNIEYSKVSTIQNAGRKFTTNTIGIDIQFCQARKLKSIDIARVAITREIKNVE